MFCDEYFTLLGCEPRAWDGLLLLLLPKLLSTGFRKRKQKSSLGPATAWDVARLTSYLALIDHNHDHIRARSTFVTLSLYSRSLRFECRPSCCHFRLAQPLTGSVYFYCSCSRSPTFITYRLSEMVYSQAQRWEQSSLSTLSTSSRSAELRTTLVLTTEASKLS